MGEGQFFLKRDRHVVGVPAITASQRNIALLQRHAHQVNPHEMVFDGALNKHRYSEHPLGVLPELVPGAKIKDLFAPPQWLQLMCVSFIALLKYAIAPYAS
jgi:hypothetical protein